MIAGVTLKVCGLTTAADAQSARRHGADYLGFNLYPSSPRHIGLDRYRSIAPDVPGGKRVAVMVEPAPAELSAASAAGFDYFQIHFRHDLDPDAVTAWSETVGPRRLWLAPKLPPTADADVAWLHLAKTFLLDTFQAEGFGGSGKTGDWAKFGRHQERHPGNIWILAGGLNPANIGEALKQSGALWIDVNSGIESAPGVKDDAKLGALVESIRRSRL